MKAPWNGEKVNLVIRFLSIVFVICSLMAFGIWVTDAPFLDNRMIIGMVSAAYCFLLFLKVAVTGYAPKTWLPWR